MAVIDLGGVPNPPYPSETLFPDTTLFPDQPEGGIPAPPVGTPRVVPIIRPSGIAAPGVGIPTLESAIRPPLRVDFWAVDDDGSLLCPLPHVVSWDLSMVPGEAGAVTLEYPVDGINYDALVERVTAARDLFIRIRTDGTHDRSLGALLYASDGDEVAEGATRTFYGRFLTGLLAEAPLPYNQSGLDGEWGWADATAGDILHAVLTILQTDGYLAGFTWTFTGDHDSNGIAWASQTSPRFPPGRTALEVAQQLREWGMLEFEVAADLEIRAFEPTAVGTDHTANDPPMVFRAGRDLSEAPRRTDVSAAATTLMIAGADGVYVEVEDPTAVATRGRKIGQFLSEGNLASSVAALAYGNLELPRRVTGTDERTRALTFDQDQPVPLRELMPLDWVYDDTGSGLRRERIAQITVSQSQGEDRYSGGIVLGDLINSRDVAIQRQLSGLAAGQIITGASTPSPSVDDGKAPGQVVGLAVASAPYPDQDRTAAIVTATWVNVTENADGTPMGDLSHFEPQFRYSGGLPGLPTAWIPAPPVLGLTATWDGVVAGTPISVRVRAVDQFGRAGAWATEVGHVTQDDATPPPTPSDPVAASYLGIFTVTWDGLGSAGEVQPPDFSHVEVHASLSAAFVPDRPLNPDGTLNTDLSTTYIDRLTGAGTMPSTIGEYGQTWFARLVSVDKSHNASAASVVDSATLVEVGDGDIASVSIGKLTAGIMNALMTVSGIIRTATSGARVELDTAGFRCYSSTGAVLLNFSIPTSLLSIVGRLTAGAGIGSGSTVVIEPGPPPSISLYPNATAERYRMFSLPFPLPTGGTGPAFGLERINTGGVSSGPSLFAWDVGVLLGHKTSAGTYTTTGGGVQLYAASTGFGAYLAADDGWLQVENNGRFRLQGRFAAGDAGSGGAGALFMGFANVTSANSGINFAYGGTMADARVILHSWQGGNTYTYLSAVSATGFTILKGNTADSGWIHYASFGTDI